MVGVGTAKHNKYSGTCDYYFIKEEMKMDWEMMAIVGWIGALIINVIFTIDTTKERRKYCEKYEKLWEKEGLLEHREAELDNREMRLERRERALEEYEEELDEREKKVEEKRYERIRKIANRPRNTPHPSANADTFSTREKALPPTTQGEWSGVPLAERGICKNCVYHEIGCFECELSCEDALERFKGSGWSEDVIKRSDLSREWCAVETGICAYYREDESDIVFCKDCKYGVKMDEPDENGLEWNCTKGMTGATWSRIGECCPCGERKKEGGNEE